MKISQMTTNQAADVLVRIAAPASKIMHDKTTMKVLEGVAKGSNDAVKFIAENLVPVTTILLKSHRMDVFEIVAALTGKTLEEVGEQNILVTISDIRDSWDGDLVDFFGSLKK